MKVILGLGNPGLKFRFSRHNLGFLAVEKLAQVNGIKLGQKRLNCLLGEGRLKGQKVLLVEPLTFVNLSGEAVSLIIKRRKMQLKELLVVCDDVNLPLGKIRLRAGGSHGGHNGLRSIIEALDNQDFPRLRIGVGRPQHQARRSKLTQHVLGRFSRSEIKAVNAVLEEALSCIQVWLQAGIARAMNKFN